MLMLQKRRKAFYEGIHSKPHSEVLQLHSLTTEQVTGFEHIFDEWDHRHLEDSRWLAYMLATVWHETAQKMQPIREMGSLAYLKSKKYWPYIGEGLVQVTWKYNYIKFGATKPGDLLQWPLALRALFDGMIGGVFSPHQSLGRYFAMRVEDPVHARKIINGMDKAALIASYYHVFLACLPAKDNKLPEGVELPPELREAA